MRNFIFGNSLINHLTDSSETTVPYWVSRLAQKAGNYYQIDGQWGFLRDFSKNLPPVPNWSFKGVRGAWNPDRRPFGDASFTSIMINPANFIQYNPPGAAFDGDNPDGATPVSSTVQIFDWANAQTPGMQFLIYEGWPDMGPFSNSVPPSKRALKRYHTYAMGEYHDWYLRYAAQVQAELPDLNVKLVPVSTILSRLLTSEPLSEIPADDLYEDNAPHGRATLYFLAAIITYSALFDEPAPEDMQMPDSIHPLVRENYASIVSTIWTDLATLADTAAAPLPTEDEPITVVTRAAAVPEGSGRPASRSRNLSNPALGMGLNGIADWSVQQPFANRMKTARTWTGHLADGGQVEAEALAKMSILDARGWPTRLPDELNRVETLVLTDMPENTPSLAGRYRVTHKGQGRLVIAGRAQNIRERPDGIWFDYTPGDGVVSLSILQTDPARTGDHIRDIAVVHERHVEQFDAGAIFNPDWLAVVDDLRLVRFMDWMFTNGSPIATWDDRPRPGDYTYTWRGAPVEIMVGLANKIGADPWFNMPHMATDRFAQRFAETVRDQLDPRLKAHVEYSNELWNWTFPQTRWVADQAIARWGEHEDGWMQFAGMRAAQMSRIWTQVFGVDADKRLMRVIATHTGWPGLEESLLNAPLGLAEAGQDTAPPAQFFDAYAVTGYFGHEMGEELAPQILNWIEDGTHKAERQADQDGRQGRDRERYVAAHRYDLATDRSIAAMRDGSLKELLTELWPYHAKIAKEHGFDLIMYEGGTHVVGLGERVDNDELTAFFTHLNYSTEVAGLYSDLLTGWDAVGGTVFNAFVDVARTSKWGSWGNLRSLSDSTPRWDVLQKYNAAGPTWDDPRAPGTFENGKTLTGTSGADVIEGTAADDILIGRDGDDRFAGKGGSDRIDGGAGQDLAELPGRRTDYRFVAAGDAMIACNKTHQTRLRSVEFIGFSGEPGARIMVDSLI